MRWPADTIRKSITFAGLVALGIYAAAHVGITLSVYESWWMGILAAFAFVCLEYASVANLVQADNAALRFVSLLTYAAMLASLGGMREWYFTREATWLTGRVLAWWVTAVGMGAGTQAALVLRMSTQQMDTVQEIGRSHELALERIRQESLTVARAQEIEAQRALDLERIKQNALVRIARMEAKGRTPQPVPAHGNGKSREEAMQVLAQRLQAEQISNLGALAGEFNRSGSTLCRWAGEKGFAPGSDGVWRQAAEGKRQ